MNEMDIVVILSILVAVLSVLVVVLIGWQVFNAIQMHTTLKEINSRMKKEIDDYNHTVSALFTQLFSIQEYFKGNHFEKAIDGFLMALEEANKGSRKDDIIDGIFSYLFAIKEKHDLYNKKRLPSGVFIIKGKKEFYLEILSKIRLKESREVADFISELDEKEMFR